MRNVKFINEGHKYEYFDGGHLQSVSGFWKKFFPAFDERNAYRKAYKEVYPDNYLQLLKEYRGWDCPKLMQKCKELALEDEAVLVIAEDYLGEWEENRILQTELGTEQHDIRELAAYDKKGYLNPLDGITYKLINNPGEFDNQTYLKGIDKIPKGVLPETLVNHPAKDICGQADKVFFKGNKHFDLIDYKTDKSMERSGIYLPSKKQSARLLKPIDWLQDCNYIKYTLKMSTYAYMLELWGYKCDKMAIILIGKGDYIDRPTEVIRIPYMRSLVKRLVG